MSVHFQPRYKAFRSAWLLVEWTDWFPNIERRAFERGLRVRLFGRTWERMDYVTWEAVHVDHEA